MFELTHGNIQDYTIHFKEYFESIPKFLFFPDPEEKKTKNHKFV